MGAFVACSLCVWEGGVERCCRRGRGGASPGVRGFCCGLILGICWCGRVICCNSRLNPKVLPSALWRWRPDGCCFSFEICTLRTNYQPSCIFSLSTTPMRLCRLQGCAKAHAQLVVHGIRAGAGSVRARQMGRHPQSKKGSSSLLFLRSRIMWSLRESVTHLCQREYTCARKLTR